MKQRLFILAALALYAMLPCHLHAQYSASVFSVKEAQDLYDERGFEHGSSVNVDGRLNVSNAGGTVSYSYPISSHVEGGYSIDVSLNYAGSVAFTTFKDYNLASRLGGNQYSGWAKFHQNRPAWIVGINGFAVNVLSSASHFRADSASRAFKTDFNSYDDGDFPFVIDGYDWSNRMQDFNPVGASGNYTDVIRILRADGSTLDLYNGHPYSTTNPDTRPELCSGYYHSNTANDPSFGIVEYDSTYWPEYIAGYTRSQEPVASHRAPLIPRRLSYYTADGLEYTFREWIIPYGLSAYSDIESRGGGIWGHPSIFYLEAIKSNAGAIVTLNRARQYPIIGNPIYQYENDTTRGRALITSWEGHQLSFGYNSMMIEALGRTTQVKFDTIMRNGNADSWETFPWANNGGMTPAASQIAAYSETSKQLFKSFLGYVTEIIDPMGRITRFDYETVSRTYEDLGFPHANPGTGHQLLTFKNYRLKSVTEPAAKYTIAYNPGTGHHITATETDQPTLNDMADTVRKFDPWGTLLTTDAYNFAPVSTTRKNTTVTSTDNLTGLSETTTYHFDYYPLGFMSGIIPQGRFTYISQIDESASDGHGGVLQNSTFTTYAQGTGIPGVGTNTSYVILPTETHTTVQGATKNYTKFRYQTDTVNRFGGNAALAGTYGVQITKKIAQTCRPNQPSKVLLTDTTEYLNLPLIDSVMTWQEWHWNKFGSLANFFALRDSNDARIRGKRWEAVMFVPPVAAVDPDTVTDLIHMPPVYGLVHASWVSDSAGCIGGIKNTYRYDVTPNAGRRIRDILLADTILGRGKATLTGHTYTYTGGWTGNSLAAKVGALGLPEEYTYNYFWTTSDSLQFGIGSAAVPIGTKLSNDDSTVAQGMDAGNGGVWYRKPVGIRNVVRKYAPGGTLYYDTLETYAERTFYGLTSGTRDANGWYTRSEFDKNGRLITAWEPGDFAHEGVYDTVSYAGTQRIDLLGQTLYNRRIDQLHCYKVSGIVTRDTITGTELTTLMPDTLYASLPVTIIPQCPCKDDAETKEKGGREIQQTCDAYWPYNQHAGYKGVYGELNYTLDTDSPIKNATRIDSMFLEFAVASVDGGCVHLVVDVDTLLEKTYVFNCSGSAYALRTKDGKAGASILSDVTEIPGGYMVRIDLTSIAATLHGRPDGSGLKTRLSTTTAGATITFINGTSSEDLRPRYMVYGAFQQVSERADYTIAYDHNDAALTATTSAKIDDRRHTANVYNDSIVHGATVRRASSKHYFGADNRLLRSERTVIEDAPRAVRVDTTFHIYTGNGQARSVRDAEGDTARTNYDGFGQAIETINHDGTHTLARYMYDSAAAFGISDQDFYGYCRAATTVNEDGVKFTTYTDAFDHLRREVADSAGLKLTTRYEYDLAGRLTRVVNPKGDTTRYWYDEFGRVQYKRQPDIGLVSYTYDQLGRVRFAQDAEEGSSNRLAFNQYDDLGRLTLTGVAYFDSVDGPHRCDAFDEDDMSEWRCWGPWVNGTHQEGNPPARTKRAGRGIQSVLGTDPAPERLTNRLNPDTLHTWPEVSLPTANPTVWMTPVRSVPQIPTAFKFISTCAQLSANDYLGETSAPVGPFIEHPAAFYDGIEPGATFDDFENVARHPEFVRVAVAYDTLPAPIGPVWTGFPTQGQWDGLAPHGAVRNQRGHEAAIAYRERAGEPYHFAVMSFDERGRVEALLRYNGDLGFDAVYYSYNALNKVTSVTAADYVRQYTTWYGYDGAGRIDSVWSSLSGAGVGLYNLMVGIVHPPPLERPDTADIVYRYTKTGQLDTMLYPPANVLVRYAYDHRKWLDSLVATQSGSNLFREVLSYDPAGQITQQVWQQGTATRQKQRYGYDSVQRLTSWTTGPEVGSSGITDTAVYTYDGASNRLTATRSGIGTAEAYTLSNTLGTGEGNQLIHRKNYNVFGDDTLHNYAYNYNGALSEEAYTFEGGKSYGLGYVDYGYSYRNLLKRAWVARTPGGYDGPTNFEDWRYRYSASGEREEKRLYDANQNDSAAKYGWVYYLLGGHSEQLAVYHGQESRKTFCSDTGRRAYLYPVEYITNGVGYTGVPEQITQVITKPNGVKEYQVSDHLASLRVAIEGGTTRRMDYDPWGNPLAGSSASDRETFNGQERDKESGLYDLSDRNFSTATGRFTKVDRLQERFRSVSPYTYCNGNPLRLTDPDGMQVKPDATTSEGGGGAGCSATEDEFFSSPFTRRGGTEVSAAGEGAASGEALIEGAIESATEAAEKTASEETASESTNTTPVREIEISKSKYPETAQHIEDAQSEGHPKELTLDREKSNVNSRRRAALKDVPTQSGMDRDEYPFAATKEGGAGSSVRYVTPSDNRGAGSLFRWQVHDLPDGSKVSIVIKP